GCHVPQAAGVWRDFIGKHNAHHVAFEQATTFDLEVDKLYACTKKHPRKEIVDSNGKRHDVVDFLRRCPAESRDVLFRNHRVVQGVGLVVEFNDRPGQNGAFFKPKPLRQGAGGNVAHDDLQRNHFHFLDQLLTHVEAADKVGWNTHAVEMRENVLGDAVVKHTFAIDDFVLLLVKRGCVVLEELDEGARLGSFVKDLGLAFINATATVHDNLWILGAEFVPGSMRRCLKPTTGFSRVL